MVCLYPKSAESLYETVFACSGCSASIVKNKFKVFERLENLLQNGILHFVFRLLLQNGILHFVFRLSQSLENCKVLLLIIRKQGYFFLDEPPSRVILASGMKNIMQ